jgi:HD-GYP domain-containing protein (c-di-GMP phosphodiesterase class II)/DNA-binding CsgD family transcriptional regulator
MGSRVEVPLAELLAALSLAADLGNDFRPEKSLRTCLIATWLCGELGLSRAETRDVYFAALLRFVGCTASAHELGATFGDDNDIRRVMATVDRASAEDRLRALRDLGRGRGLFDTFRMATRMLAKGDEVLEQLATADCEVSAHAATRIGVGGDTPSVLRHSFTRWDGRGAPRGIAGEAIDRRARLIHVASFAETRHRMGGAQAAVDAIARGAGGWFDPDIASTFVHRGRDLLERIDPDSVWDVVLEAEPRPRRFIPESGIDDLALAFADLVDLKSTYRLGHSPAVADLAVRAAESLGRSAEEITTLRRAALLHDIGMYSVPTGILDKKGRLTASEWERIRLHAYHSERILARSVLLSDAAKIASLHHERLDGSGYHRAARAAAQSVAARVLAVADVFQSLTEPRPYRVAFAKDAAAKLMESASNVMDGDIVRAVCAVAGVPGGARRRNARPSGLSDREIEVLRLLARGRSKKQIGRALFISAGTVHTHVTHIYEKLGISGRAEAALYALEHGLLPD